jgi:hypothetical protein
MTELPHVSRPSTPRQTTDKKRIPPKPPKALGVAGSGLWRGVVAVYELRSDELEVLDQACRVRDTLDRLDQALVDAPLTMLGSAGQVREHPLLSEARQQRAAFARLLGQLALPDTEGPSVAQSRSAWGRHMARARWGSA